MKERKINLSFNRDANKGGYTDKAATRQGRVPRHKQGEHFLKGPIPLDWLTEAAKLPGKALHVAAALWYRSGLTGSPAVKLSNILVALFGVERDAKRRALRQLEAAGMVHVDHQPNASPIVHLREAPARNDDVRRTHKELDRYYEPSR